MTRTPALPRSLAHLLQTEMLVLGQALGRPQPLLAVTKAEARQQAAAVVFADVLVECVAEIAIAMWSL